MEHFLILVVVVVVEAFYFVRCQDRALAIHFSAAIIYRFMPSPLSILILNSPLLLESPASCDICWLHAGNCFDFSQSSSQLLPFSRIGFVSLCILSLSVLFSCSSSNQPTNKLKRSRECLRYEFVDICSSSSTCHAIS